MKLKSIFVVVVCLMLSILGSCEEGEAVVESAPIKYKVEFTKDEYSLDELIEVNLSLAVKPGHLYKTDIIGVVEYENYDDKRSWTVLHEIEEKEEKYTYVKENGEIVFNFTTKVYFSKDVLLNNEGAVTFAYLCNYNNGEYRPHTIYGMGNFKYIKDVDTNTVKFLQGEKQK